MIFAHPEWLWGLAALPLLLAALIWQRAWARRRWARFAQPETGSRILLGRPAPFLAKALLLTVSCALVLVALARPRWGETTEEIETLGIDLVVALDLSRSMLAEDVAPSRLVAARSLANELASRLPSDRFGLVGFAGGAATLCPLTFDRGAFELYLDSAGPSVFSAQGTALAAAVLEARDLFERRGLGRRVLVILSDGEDRSDELDEAIAAARGSNIRIYALGIGTPTGAPIPNRDESGRVRTYHRDRSGERVTTRLDETALVRLARETGGTYMRASGIGQGLVEIAGSIERIERDALTSTLGNRLAERYQWPLSLAFALLAIDAALTGRRRRRS